MYNPERRDHMNLRYGNPPLQGNQGRQFHPHGFQPQQNYQRDNPLLHLQTPMLWGHRVMIFIR